MKKYFILFLAVIIASVLGSFLGGLMMMQDILDPLDWIREWSIDFWPVHLTITLPYIILSLFIYAILSKVLKKVDHRKIFRFIFLANVIIPFAFHFFMRTLVIERIAAF
jgi:hypothetical protein